MNELELLEMYKDDAMEQLAENERVIASQKERIAELEYHMGRIRDQAYLIITATAGVVPIVFEPDAPTKKTKTKKVKS